MESSDKIVANQIKEFNHGLRLLASHLTNARQDFRDFSAETKTRGKNFCVANIMLTNAFQEAD